MSDRTVKLRELIQILGKYGVEWDVSRGKGSHGIFWKFGPTGKLTYPVPTTSKDVHVPYIRGCRKKFKLTAVDGISDKDFYGK